MMTRNKNKKNAKKNREIKQKKYNKKILKN